MKQPCGVRTQGTISNLRLAHRPDFTTQTRKLGKKVQAGSGMRGWPAPKAWNARVRSYKSAANLLENKSLFFPGCLYWLRSEQAKLPQSHHVLLQISRESLPSYSLHCSQILLPNSVTISGVLCIPEGQTWPQRHNGEYQTKEGWANDTCLSLN